MRLSYVTIDRILEQKMAVDAEYRDLLNKQARPMLSRGRAMSDEALLAKLSALGVTMDHDSFVAQAGPFLSAQALAEVLIGQFESELPGHDEDWIWIALTCLWERWLPNRPSMEMIDDWMQAGYESLKARDVAAACRKWLATWQNIWRIMQDRRLRTIDEFDELFRGTQSLFNWLQDFSMELHNAGRADPAFFRERITILETLLNQVDLPDSIRLNFRNELAESYFATGEAAKGEQLYHAWLETEPRWGFGWMAWSDCYAFWPPKENRDLARAEAILKQGLAIAGVEDREYLLERLADIYKETGRNADAEPLRAEISRLHSSPPRPAAATLARFAAAAAGNRAPARPTKLGRNDPCPCGSGKKFKHCCAKRKSLR
jgi:SEC-C motif